MSSLSSVLQTRWKYVIAAIVCVTFVWYFCIYSADRFRRQGYGRTDFAVFYVTAATVTHQMNLSPQDIFNRPVYKEAIASVRRQSGGTKYIYSLSSAWLFSPLALFSYQHAWKLWMYASVLSVIASYYLSVRYWASADPFQLRYTLLFAVLAFGEPVRKLIQTGQVNGFLLLGIVIAGIPLSKQMAPKVARSLSLLGGALLGIVAVIKYFSIGFVPVLLLRKQWQMLGSLSVAVLCIVLVSCVIYPPKQVVQYALGVHGAAVSGDLGRIQDGTTLQASYHAGLEGRETFLGKRVTKQGEWDIYRILKVSVQAIGLLCAAVIGGLYVREWWTGQILKTHAYWVLDYTIAMSFLLLFAAASHRQFHLFFLPFFVWSVSQLSSPILATVRWNRLKTWKHLWVSEHAPFFIGMIALFLTNIYILLVADKNWTVWLFKPETIGIFIIFGTAFYYRFRHTFHPHK